MNYFKLLLMSCFIISHLSCNDDEENDVDSDTNSITGKNWVLTSAVADPPMQIGETSVSNIFSLFPACKKDDIIRFNTNGTMKFEEGATKCSPEDPQSISGIWSFDTEKTVLTITSEEETNIFDIIDISNTTLKVSYHESDEETDEEYIITATYSAR